MPKFLSLLFISLLCTCVRAQITDKPIMGSGSMVVNFEAGAWAVTVTSATYRAHHNFVTKSEYTSHPNDFAGFTVIPDQERYDLRMVHYLIDQLEEIGWQLVSSDHTVGLSESDLTFNIAEKMFFRFRVPRVKVSPSLWDSETMVLRASVPDGNPVVIRGGILKTSAGKHFLLVEEAVGEQWFEKLKLSDTGLLTDDMVKRITKLQVAGSHISLQVELATGAYSYRFQRAEGSYRLAKLVFRSNSECGVQSYELGLIQKSMNAPIGYYRPEPCAAAKELRPFYSKEVLGHIFLKDFMPGSRSVKIKRPATTVYY